MIQRIQTIWLLFASIASFVTLKLSFYSGIKLPENVYHQLTGTENSVLFILTVALAVSCLIIIFLYKDRVMQMRLCIAAILLDILIIYLYYRQISLYTQGTYNLWSIVHLFIIITLSLAVRAINNDEKLVKNSDRLR